MQKQSRQAIAIAVACGFLLGSNLVGEAAATDTATDTSTVAAITTTTDTNPVAKPATATTAATNATTKGQVKKAPAAAPLPVPVKEPITITADELYMNDDNGDVYAKGNVKMNQGSQQLLTDLLNGNTKQQEIWIKGQADYTEPMAAAHMDGLDTRYNYQTKEGTMGKMNGKIGKDIIAGESVILQPDEYVLHNGTVTRCPAKVPDYHLSADRIEIWPNDKLIAYNAKFWIKNTVIFGMPTYQTSLKPGAVGVLSMFPTVSYSSQDGLAVKEDFDIPVGKNLSSHFDLDYYTRRGLKPNAGITWGQPDYTVGIVDGYYRDGNANWVKKQPELDFNWLSHRIGKTPFSYTFSAIYGQWSEDAVTSWHQEYNLYFARDVIQYDKKNSLALGAGLGYSHESYNESRILNYKLDGVFTHVYNTRLSVWVGYHSTQTQNTLFAYDRADMSHELDTGFSYTFNPKNSLRFNQSYDVVNQRVFDQDVSWIHDFHCWVGTFTYRIKRSQWQWDFAIKRW